jgi:hypothetical protein
MTIGIFYFVIRNSYFPSHSLLIAPEGDVQAVAEANAVGKAKVDNGKASGL